MVTASGDYQHLYQEVKSVDILTLESEGQKYGHELLAIW